MIKIRLNWTPHFWCYNDANISFHFSFICQ